ncbi:hypothetical protein OG895_36355 [Streptomyces sp. NBC_00201]|uniref:hypothetical protein n=1 Tax=unclassified Streptomyces TaxID=2593676 RepID=UPI00225A7AD7|nr:MULTISPECIES: hypothetical protein [unclassified Streptomyces]MCX5250613.1 hypothetical protein [Streptomyces sp. NBC_00201]MCX5291458.1 hypothetical protein [Streptomyces sp. NBC_00183]
MTAGWCSRTLRAAVFAAVCVLLAALGHILMSGSDVPAWALAAGGVGTGAVGWCLAWRERGLPLIVAAVVAAQAALHEAFSFAQWTTEASGSSASMDMGSMHMGSMDSMDMAHMDHMGHAAAGGSSSGMLAAHLLAALLCGLWLAYGEKAAFRILRAVAGWLAAPLRLLLALPATPERPRPHLRRRRSDREPRLLLLVHAITSRGPPAGTAVA